MGRSRMGTNPRDQFMAARNDSRGASLRGEQIPGASRLFCTACCCKRIPVFPACQLLQVCALTGPGWATSHLDIPLHPRLVLRPERRPGCPEGPRAVAASQRQRQLLQPVCRSAEALPPLRALSSPRTPAAAGMLPAASLTAPAGGGSKRRRRSRATVSQYEQDRGPRDSHRLGTCRCRLSRSLCQEPEGTGSRLAGDSEEVGTGNRC